MPFTNFPYGVTSFGIPQTGAIAISIPSGTLSTAVQSGAVWFVDPNNVGGIHTGFSPSEAFQTIQDAVDAAGDGTGDTIFVFPGSYDENVTVDKDYIAIIGAQLAGYARPDVVPTTGVALTVTGQGFYSNHVRYVSDDDDAVIQRGNGYLYADCVLDGNLTADKAGIRLLPSDTDDSFTASEGEIAHNYIRGNAVGIIFDTGAAPAVGVGSTDNNIHHNRFSRNTIDIATADAGGGVYSVQFAKIGPDNHFEDKNKTTYIDLTTTNGGAAGDQSGAINGNFFAIDKGGVTGDTGAAAPTTTQIKMVGTAFTFTGNWGTIGALDGSGLD